MNGAVRCGLCGKFRKQESVMGTVCTDCMSPVELAQFHRNNPPTKEPGMKSCAVEECEKPSSSAGLCSMHYARKQRHGSVDHVEFIYGDRLAAWNQKVDKSGDCWEWTASRSGGYGQFSFTVNGKRRPTHAHRAGWELLVGPIPEGMFIDHKCHNKGCVNPDHLRLATPRQNNENYGGMRKDNTTGFRGVRQRPSGKWYGRAVSRGVEHQTPAFDTPEEANEAAIALRIELHTFNDLDRIHQQKRAA